MRPTDDELEATAAELQRFAANELTDRTAAMLRECKTGDAPDHSDWNAAIEAAAKVAREMANSEANMSPTWRAGCSDCHDALSQLKKGSPHE